MRDPILDIVSTFRKMSTQSDQAQTERIRLVDAAHLRIDTVVDDPVAFKIPWRYSRTYERSSSGMFEIVCLDNNRELNSVEPDLTPPSN